MNKRLVLVLLAVAALTAACKKDISKKISVTGQWELTDVVFSTKTAVVGNETVCVYIDFISGGTFNLYQRLGEGRYISFSGSWSLSGDLLSVTRSRTCPFWNLACHVRFKGGNDCYRCG